METAMSEEDAKSEKSEKKPKFKKGRKFSRTSVVARLGRVIRDKVDEMIDDGVLYKDISKWVKEQTGKELKVDALSTWRLGGHERWLGEQERLREMRETREFALQVMRENQGKVVSEAGLEVAASQLYQMLMKFNLAELKKKLKAEPEAYSKLLQMLARVSGEGLKHERHRAELERDKAKVEKEARAEEKAKESEEEMDEVLRALGVG